MVEYSKGFDARSLTPAQARTVVQLCSTIQSCAGSMKAMAAAVVAEGSSYRAEGHRSPEAQLARDTGMSPSQARRALVTGRRLLGQPEVAAAALAGDLSTEQAEAVAAAAEANPAKTKELLQQAGQASVPELNEAVAKARAAGTDLEARRRAIHARRTLSRFTDMEGVYHAHLAGNPEDGITIDQVITEVRRKLATNRRARDIPSEKLATLDYDAVVALFDLACGKDSEVTLPELLEIGLFPQFDPTTVTVPTARTGPSPSTGPAGPARPAGPPPIRASSPPSHPELLSLLDDDAATHAADPVDRPTGEAPGDPPPRSAAPEHGGDPPATGPPSARSGQKGRLAGRPAKIIIRIDLDTLLRGYPLDGELCDCPGYGPIPVSLIHDLMGSGQARLAAVLTKGKEVRAVHLSRRHPNEYQKAALDLLYPVCAVKGCNTRAGLEADHRHDWAKTHYTVIDLLDHLCWHHHQLKTRQGWALVEGHGKRDLVPPDDPRHPRHSRHHSRSPDGSAAARPPVCSDDVQTMTPL